VVGEVGRPNLVRLSRVSGEVPVSRRRCRHRKTLMELPCLPERSRVTVRRYSVHGTPPRRFDGHAVLGISPSGTEAPEAPIGLGSPPGHTGKSPPESCAAPATLVRFDAPTATSAREVHGSRDSSPGSFRLQGFSPS
jgi:hypothetical protein